MTNSILKQGMRATLGVPSLFVVAIMLPVLLSVAGAQERGYGVQLASFEKSRQGDANTSAQSVPADVRSSVQVVLAEERWRVLLGPFAHYPDALLVRDHIRTRLPSATDAFVYRYDSPGEKEFTLAVDLLPSLFGTNGLVTSELPIQTVAGDPIYESLRALDRPGNDESYEVALKARASTVPNEHPVAGYIGLNLGIQRIKAGELDDALELLLPVAHGEVNSAAVHRVMAIRRVAWIWHQQGDRLGAYRAYRELERFSSSELVRATCAAECVGLLMELAESGNKGTHEDVRREIARYLDLIPERYVRQRALLHLMEHESWARQPDRDLERAALLGEELVARYSGLPEPPLRELATASWQTAMYHRLAGNQEKALEWTYRTLRDYPEDVETFANSHPHAKAKFQLTEMVFLTGTRQEYFSMLRDLIREYPQDRLVQRMADIYPHLRN
ncbi:MAG: SPOR domain-containing protein [Candidatus Sumerlaeia bacterium]|nr:SPOR domain-containing protein [Candidatus Sumerlaeia bacterium]